MSPRRDRRTNNQNATVEIEARRQALLSSALDCIICTDARGRITDFNPAAQRTFRIPQAQALGKDAIETLFPAQLRQASRLELFRLDISSDLQMLANRIETTGIRSDGSTFPLELTINPLIISGERSFTIYIRDITARKRAEEALVWHAAIVESSREAIIGKDLNDKITSWNQGAELMYGYAAKEAIGRNMTFLIPHDRLHEIEPIVENLKKGVPTNNFETVRVTKHGKRIDVSLNVFPVQGSDNRVIGACVMARDITEWKRVQNALSKANQTSVYACPVAIIAADLNRHIVLWNRAAEEVFGWKEEEVLGKPNPIIPDEEIENSRQLHRKIVAGETLRGIEASRLRKDGTRIVVSISAMPLLDEFGKTRGLMGFLNDISELKRTENALQKAEEKYRSIYENALEGIYQSTVEGQFISVNPALAQMFGFDSPEEMIRVRQNIQSQEYFEPEVRTEFVRLLQQQGVVRNFEYQALRKDSKKIWVSQNARTVHDLEGNILYFEGTVQDITQRRGLEQQLRQMQKIEAIGRLAGGVAHDFNNILMAASSFAELLYRKMPENDPSRWYVDEIMKATGRGAGLTQGLLAFSRKQVFSPKVLDLNVLVQNQIGMLKRLIPENIDLRFIPDSALHKVKVDPSQLEQVVMNLVINARDAMPQGGKIRITTRNSVLPKSLSEPGLNADYVMLVVVDTGCGMSLETQSKVFEPFFTTKEQGKGTGLGLATVLGIIEQSGGHVTIDSQQGKGTTFRVYLPISVEEEVSESSESLPSDLEGNETILVVEDEPSVRKSAVEYLLSCGYRVLQASCGDEGLDAATRHLDPIHLLISDVIMPGMSGVDLCKRFNLIHPETKVLFMSGYSNNLLSEHQVLDKKYTLLHKPFPLATLGRAVRNALHKKVAVAAAQ